MSRLLLFLLALPLAAQQTLTLAGPATARPGQAITVSVAYSGATASGLQWDLVLPVGLSGTATAGACATAANKQLVCHQARCIAYGMNQTAMTAGDVASYTLTVATVASGTLRLNLSTVLGATGSGSAISGLTAGPELAIVVLRREDIDGNGAVTATDASLAADQAIGKAACGSGDVNGDAKCDLIDVLLVVLAALGV